MDEYPTEPALLAPRVRRAAVIGGGAAGLAAAKALLEVGVAVVVYEREPAVCGVWRWESRVPTATVDGVVCDRQARPYASLTTNTSRQMMQLSDFGFQFPTRPFPAHGDIARFLCHYAAEFGLAPHVRCGAAVHRVWRRAGAPAHAHDAWCVESVAAVVADGGSRCETFDAVVVASGQFSVPTVPRQLAPGFGVFRGAKLHSSAFRDARQFAGQRVLIVGIGNTACDLAVELADVCAEVVVSSRSGTMIVPGVANGEPFDVQQLTRLNERLPKKLAALRFYRLAAAFQERAYAAGVPRPKRPGVGALLTIVKEPERFLAASKRNLRFVGAIERFEANLVKLKSGESLPIDAVILATGYAHNIDQFLDPEFSPSTSTDGRPWLDTYMRLLSVHTPRLAFCCFFENILNNGVLAEAQARYLAQLWSCAVPCPSRAQVDRERAARRRALERLKPRYPLYAPPFDYFGRLAREGGFEPPPALSARFLLHPRVMRSLAIGPVEAAQYRLQGANAKPAVAMQLLENAKL